MSILLSFFFFFQAEDGIRDDLVTGVQTCALPISLSVKPFRPFTSLQDYTFADVLIRAHTGAKSIDQLLSTYPPGHLSFKSHKDVFNIVDQASRVAPMVSSPFFPFSFFSLPILLTHHPFWLVQTSQC